MATVDVTLDTLLDLDGQALVVDPKGGHWVRFVVTRVPITLDRPMGSTTRLHCMGRMASGWSGSTMRMWSGSRNVESLGIISIG